MKQILEALNYSHTKNIAHRDLKDENILVTHDGTVKIIDFGLAKNFNKFTMCTVAGSPLFMAPEVMGQKYTKKCDLWSLGILVFMLFSEQFPFELDEDANDLSVFYKVICEGQIQWNTFWDDSTEDLQDFLKNLITKEAQRFTAA